MPVLLFGVVILAFVVILKMSTVEIARNDENDKVLASFVMSGPKEYERSTKLATELQADASRTVGYPIPTDVFLLATMASSEYNGYSASQNLKAAVMHASLNMARKQKKTLTKMLIPDGRFGSQRGRYAATRRAPRLYDLLIAQAVIDGRINDNTSGAVQFDDPRTQDKLAAARDDYKTSSEVANERIKAGRRLVTIPGEDPNKVRFWA